MILEPVPPDGLTRHRLRGLLALLLSALLAGGCVSPAIAPPSVSGRAADLPGPDAQASERRPGDSEDLFSPDQPLVAGYSLEGRPVHCHVLGTGPHTVMLLATIHGNEAAGTPLLERLLEEVRADSGLLFGRRLVVVPVVNPDGLAARKRRNARGVDLNRNFGSDNRADGGDRGSALSEPEAEVLSELITEFEPMVVVSIHGWIGLIDWDGPAQSLAAELGALCQLPAQRLGSRPGSLGSYLGVDRQVPIITFELPGSARRDSDDELWERYGPALLATLSWMP